ncbi:MAG: hypothetical protein C5B50_00145 [Verrucomicrobia bacterium]|nr:MAG: hypothetical protein C5B50_00145 [Verrucomicrobiota bacterium]
MRTSYKVAVVFGLVALVATVGYLPVRTRLARIERDSKQFCETLIPRIEQSRSGSGSYPTNYERAWLDGLAVPATIQISDFYLGQGDRYFLRFYRPGLWRHSFYCVWCYHSHGRQWIEQYEY